MYTNSLFLKEKESIILNELNEKKRITVQELADVLKTSSGSVRRYLSTMQKEGKLIRTHGGAILMEEIPSEDIIEQRRTSNLLAKKLIAKTVRKYINDGDTLILGGGTTILELAKQLFDLKNSIIITNSIITASELYKNSNIEVRICGGTIRPNTSSIIGPEAEKFVENTFVNKVFIGSDAISIEHGLTTINSLEAEVEKRIIAAGQTVYVLADHSKMDSKTLMREAPLSAINCIITDKDTNKDFIEKIKREGVEVIIARYE